MTSRRELRLLKEAAYFDAGSNPHRNEKGKGYLGLRRETYTGAASAFLHLESGRKLRPLFCLPP
jgi:hypothetical protein